MPTRPSTLALALAAAFGAFPVHQAVAAGCVWTPASGIWGIAGNWASCGGQVPALADSASVAAGKTASVTNLQSVQSLGNAGTINIDGSNVGAQLVLLGVAGEQQHGHDSIRQCWGAENR